MKKDSNITIPALAELLKVTDKTIKRDIENLKKKGLLKRIGVGKEDGNYVAMGYWQSTKCFAGLKTTKWFSERVYTE